VVGARRRWDDLLMSVQLDPVHHTIAGVLNPIVRAIAPDGDILDEPSEDLLLELLNDCQYNGDFVIVEKDDTHFAQTAWSSEEPWVVEYRNGTADAHFQARTGDKHVVHNVLLGFAYDLPGWETLVEWNKVEFG
jgi:hypothetical protein